MRYLLVMLLAATLLITACTKPVDNEEIEDVNDQTQEEQVEENIDEQDPSEEEPNNDNEKQEKPNKDQEKNNGSNGEATKDQDNKKENNQGNTEPKDNNQNKTDRDTNELLTEQEAIAKVKSYLQLQFEPDVHVVVDHEENGRYLVHVYEVIPGNNGVGHTSTRGWYYVDRKTGEIESMF